MFTKPFIIQFCSSRLVSSIKEFQPFKRLELFYVCFCVGLNDSYFLNVLLPR